MCQEVTKHQLPRGQILWEFAWSNYFNSFCLCWWTSQFGWWRGRRKGKSSQHKAFWLLRDRLSSNVLVSASTAPPGSLPAATPSADLLGMTKCFILFPTDWNSLTIHPPVPLENCFTLNCWFAARNCTTPQVLQTKPTVCVWKVGGRPLYANALKAEVLVVERIYQRKIHVQVMISCSPTSSPDDLLLWTSLSSAHHNHHQWLSKATIRLKTDPWSIVNRDTNGNVSLRKVHVCSYTSLNANVTGFFGVCLF